MNIYVLLAITILGYSLSVIFEKKTLQIIESEEAIVFKGILYLIFGVIMNKVTK